MPTTSSQHKLNQKDLKHDRSLIYSMKMLATIVNMPLELHHVHFIFKFWLFYPLVPSSCLLQFQRGQHTSFLLHMGTWNQPTTNFLNFSLTDLFSQFYIKVSCNLLIIHAISDSIQICGSYRIDILGNGNRLSDNLLRLSASISGLVFLL
jgi:hypothetical protein